MVCYSFYYCTTLGLSAIAFEIPLTPAEISNGLVAPTAASTVLGETGAVLLLAIVFIAVTAAGSAQLIAVSSLVTYDIYRTYKRPQSTGRELMRVSRKAIIGFGVGMGILASILLQVGVSLQYVYLTMGIWIGSSVTPILLSVIWKKTNKSGAIAGCLGGLASGISIWLMSSFILYGELSIMSTGRDIPLLLGNLTSISVGSILTIFISIIRRHYFNFEVMKQKILVVDEKIRQIIEQDNDEQFLKKSANFSYRIVFALVSTLIVFWPLPLYFSNYVFSHTAFSIWISIAVTWVIGSAIVIVIKPLIEGKVGITQVLKMICLAFLVKLRPNPSSESSLDYTVKQNQSYFENTKRILVPIDGSLQSLKALNGAVSLSMMPHRPGFLL
jgi:urea-proton symporter